VFILTFIPFAAISVFLIFYLIGPHSGIIPEKFQSPVFILLIVFAFGIPLWAAYKIYVKLKRQSVNVKI